MRRRPAAGGRANLGASPGYSLHAAPYLYVRPWGDERPGDASFWNDPFGAVVGCAEIYRAEDPLADATAFLTRGLELLD